MPIGRVFALDVADKEGETVSFGNLELDVAQVDEFDFANASLAIFVGGAEMTRRYAPEARQAGCAIIDFSSVYRMAEDVPLYVPGVNDAVLDELGEGLAGVGAQLHGNAAGAGAGSIACFGSGACYCVYLSVGIGFWPRRTGRAG